MVLPELGEKKPAQRGGQKVEILILQRFEAHLIVRATDLPGRALVFRYYLLNIAGEAETATPLPNVLVVLRGAGCLPVSMPQSAWPALHLQITVSDWSPLRIGGIHHTKNLTSDETRFNALRRCDRGTDAMHLANTPVVSPESKSPRR